MWQKRWSLSTHRCAGFIQHHSEITWQTDSVDRTVMLFFLGLSADDLWVSVNIGYSSSLHNPLIHYRHSCHSYMSGWFSEIWHSSYCRQCWLTAQFFAVAPACFFVTPNNPACIVLLGVAQLWLYLCTPDDALHFWYLFDYILPLITNTSAKSIFCIFSWLRHGQRPHTW